MSHSRNSIKKGYIGDYICDHYRGGWDTRSCGYGSYKDYKGSGFILFIGFRTESLFPIWYTFPFSRALRIRVWGLGFRGLGVWYGMREDLGK